MLNAQIEFHSSKTERDKEFYYRQIKTIDNQIDEAVFDLYDLTKEERDLVSENL